MSYFTSLRQNKLAGGLLASFWLLVALVSIVSNLRSVHVAGAFVFGSLPLLCLGYSLYGKQFSRARWRNRSVLHHILWVVVAVGAISGVVLSFRQFLV